MRFFKFYKNRNKGISSVVGGLFFLVLMTAGFSVYYVALDNQSKMIHTQQVIADTEVKKIREKFTISVSTDPNDNNRLEIQVKNQGFNTVEIADAWIINKTITNQPAKKHEVKYSDAFIPAKFSGDIFANTPLYMSPGEYDIKVISTLGTIVTEEEFDPSSSGRGVVTGSIFMDFTTFEFCVPAVDDCTSNSSDWVTAWDGIQNTAYIWRINLANMGSEDILVEQHTALFMLHAQSGGGGNLPKVFFILNDTSTSNEGPTAYPDHSKIIPNNGIAVVLYFGAVSEGSSTLQTSHNVAGIISVDVLNFGHLDVNGNEIYDNPGDPTYSQNLAFQSIRLI